MGAGDNHDAIIDVVERVLKNGPGVWLKKMTKQKKDRYY